MDLRSHRSLRALASAALALAAALTVAAAPEPEPLRRFEFVEPQMGVPFRIVLYAPDAAKAEAASKAAFQRVSHLNQIMSDYETDSELNELSRTSGKGTAVRVSDELWNILRRADVMARRSQGAFDITAGPAVTLWRRARRTQQLPEPDRLARARKAIGYDKVRFDPVPQTVELVRPGMKLDLGGIAKGYALEAAFKVLESNGLPRALVSGGGDIVVGDPPPGQRGWRIEIAPLDIPNPPPPRYAVLTRMALATSGDVFQRLEIEGRRYSHIVDPRTGIGLTDHSLVTVIAPDGTTADSLATAASVLGPREGLQLIEDTPGAEAVIVRKPDTQIETLESNGFARFLEQSVD